MTLGGCLELYSPLLIQDMFVSIGTFRKFGSPTWSRDHYYVVLEQRIELALRG